MALPAQLPVQLLPTPGRLLVSDTPAQLCPHAPLPGVQVRVPFDVNVSPLHTSAPRGLQVQPLTVRGVRVCVPVLVPVCAVWMPAQLQAHPPQPCTPSVQVRVRDREKDSPEHTSLRAGLQALYVPIVRATHGVQQSGSVAPLPLQLVPVPVWRSVSISPLQLMVQVPGPGLPGVQVRVRVWLKSVPLHSVLVSGDQRLQPPSTRSVHGCPGGPHPIAFCVPPPQVVSVCSKGRPCSTVPHAGTHVGAIVPTAGRVSSSGAPAQLVVQVPVPGVPGVQVSRRACVNDRPSHTV